MRIGWPQVIFIALIVVLIFGANRLPDLARSLGQSFRILRDEAKSLGDDDDPKSAKSDDKDQGKA